MVIRLLNLDELEDRGLDVHAVGDRLQAHLKEKAVAIKLVSDKHLLTIRQVRHCQPDGKLKAGKDRYLDGKAWLNLFDWINDLLDELNILAIAQTDRVRFRIGAHRRQIFDDKINRISSVFELRHSRAFKYGSPADYQVTKTHRLVQTEGGDLSVMTRLRDGE